MKENYYRRVREKLGIKYTEDYNKCFSVFLPMYYIPLSSSDSDYPSIVKQGLILKPAIEGQPDFDINQLLEAINFKLKENPCRVGVTHKEAEEIANQHEHAWPPFIVELKIPIRLLKKEGEYLRLAQGTDVSQEMLISMCDCNIANTQTKVFKVKTEDFWKKDLKIYFNSTSFEARSSASSSSSSPQPSPGLASTDLPDGASFPSSNLYVPFEAGSGSSTSSSSSSPQPSIPVSLDEICQALQEVKKESFEDVMDLLESIPNERTKEQERTCFWSVAVGESSTNEEKEKLIKKLVTKGLDINVRSKPKELTLMEMFSYADSNIAALFMKCGAKKAPLTRGKKLLAFGATVLGTAALIAGIAVILIVAWPAVAAGLATTAGLSAITTALTSIPTALGILAGAGGTAGGALSLGTAIHMLRKDDSRLPMPTIGLVIAIGAIAMAVGGIALLAIFGPAAIGAAIAGTFALGTFFSSASALPIAIGALVSGALFTGSSAYTLVRRIAESKSQEDDKKLENGSNEISPITPSFSEEAEKQGKPGCGNLLTWCFSPDKKKPIRLFDDDDDVAEEPRLRRS